MTQKTPDSPLVVPIAPPVGYPFRLFRTGTEQIDTDQDGAPEVTALDIARDQFLKTPWPESAFHAWTYRRYELEQAAKIPPEDLHRPPSTEGLTPEQIAFLYPESAEYAARIRWIPPKMSAVRHEMYIDTLRLFWDYEPAVELTHSTTFANWMFHDRADMPGCLFVTVAPELTDKTREILESYLRQMVASDRRVVLIDESRGRRVKDVLPSDLVLHCTPCPER